MRVNKKKFITISAFLIVGLFFSTYYIVNKKIEQRDLKYLNTLVEETNASKANEILKNDLKVVFYTENTKDKVTTIKALIDEYKIDKKNVTENELAKAVSKDGYKLSSRSNEGIIFRRDSKDSLEKNTYYIGEKDGYLAIYKTDDNGNLNIHKVYSDDISIDNFMEVDANKIKNYKYFNSKNLNEVEEKITELTT
ncbi:hypothetical protein BH721_10650 [Clostridium baratii]|uniref:Bypass of forespore C C-terminal domain-containing protein n=1 Tax=Clostridium baratii TaxID=1561 RepID=A0A174PW98_9CLOT|nr:hypothetical protein [Clostridium baratii]OPF51922.1 hypothetical protein A1M12_05165 [Clostridium baratii]OPF53567.1 hypothetical protein BH721_10650 [Clostridium baratii]OPF56500.1 hypothetical protein BH724_11885 [Clostridium baratii]OPF60614.1 hypothetical protein BH725_08615 [Clostridium baratii]CUP63457.1 Uncharacterised protein [Clostridium baratii]